MATYYCYECDEPVSRGVALMRSINFEQVAFHRECWAAYSGQVIPAPRASMEDASEHLRA